MRWSRCPTLWKGMKAPPPLWDRLLKVKGGVHGDRRLGLRWMGRRAFGLATGWGRPWLMSLRMRTRRVIMVAGVNLWWVALCLSMGRRSARLLHGLREELLRGGRR